MALLKRSHRCSGLLIGAAVGDALGAPFEFEKAGTYNARFPKSVYAGIGEMIGGGHCQWQPGEFTDDTQMALSLALSILEFKDFNEDHVWSYWRSWAKNATDIGNTTRHALSFTDRSQVVHHNIENTAANGALMRAFPIALLNKSRDELKKIVLAQGKMTHPHPAASYGAWLGVAMMNSAIQGNDPFQTLESELELLPEELAKKFKDLLSPQWQPSADRINNGSVWGCLAEAVWAVRNSKTFEESVIRAINFGDDTDTVACVAGAIAGAIHGIQAIPSRWTTYLNGVIYTPDEQIEFDNASLSRLSRELADLKHPPDNPDELPARLEAIEDGVFAANRSGAAGAPKEWAIISLCLVGDRFKNYKYRREIYLVDSPDDANPSLGMAVDDAVKSINAFLGEGRTALVHCHGGRSRTGLILKAWKMKKEGWIGPAGEEKAHQWLTQKWDLYRNTHFQSFLVK